MSLTKMLWTALGGALSIIVLLVAAWGRDINSRMLATEQRQDITDQRYATLLTEMQDLRDHFKELEDSVNKHAK